MGDITSKFDLSFLKKLSGGDNDFILEMINTFKEMTPEFVSNSKKYLDADDYQSLSREVHKYITGVSFLGIKELEKNLLLIEEYSKKEENIDQLERLLIESFRQIDDIIATFNKEFNLN